MQLRLGYGSVQKDEGNGSWKHTSSITERWAQRHRVCGALPAPWQQHIKRRWCRLHIHTNRESFISAQTSSPSVEVKNISKNTKMRLCTSIVIPSAIYASECAGQLTRHCVQQKMSAWYNGSVIEGPHDKWRTSINCRHSRPTGHCGRQAEKIHRACTAPPDVTTSQSGDRLDSGGRK